MKVGNIEIGHDKPLAFICGPCAIESESQCLEIAGVLKKISADLAAPMIFKASWDKANRSSGFSYRGLGLLDGLDVLALVRSRTGLPVTTDIHESSDAPTVAAIVDLIQIPALLCRQTNLLSAAAKTGLPVNVKKGQFMDPRTMHNVIDKLLRGGARREDILITERGTTFGYGDVVADMRSIPIMRGFQGKTQSVCFDCSHTVQRPGANGDRSGGDRWLSLHLARAAVAAGADAIFCEVAVDPDKALSDGPSTLALADLPELIRSCQRIREVVLESGRSSI